jgi:superfamily I DNA/RNA helicase
LEINRPSVFIEAMVKKIKYRDFLVKEEWWEMQADEKYENIWQIINMAEKYIEKWEDTLRQFMEEVTLLSDVIDSKDWDADVVKLMTIHSSKWLEFPIVFVTWLEDNIFPLTNSMMEPKLLEEERRLMYVAVTRAKDVLFLSHANSRMTRWQTKMNPPSRFLDEIPADLLKKYDLSSWWADEKTYDIDEWNIVRHKLFGTWYVLEVWNNLAIVKFHNPKFGVRKIECRFLDVIW